MAATASLSVALPRTTCHSGRISAGSVALRVRAVAAPDRTPRRQPPPPKGSAGKGSSVANSSSVGASTSLANGKANGANGKASATNSEVNSSSQATANSSGAAKGNNSTISSAAKANASTVANGSTSASSLAKGSSAKPDAVSKTPVGSSDKPAEVSKPAPAAVSQPAPAAVSKPAPAAAGRKPARLVFLDEEGQEIKPMPADYGFRSGSGRLYQQDYGTIPKNVFALSAENFRRELRALRRAARYDELAGIAGDAGPSPGPLLRAGFAVGQALRGAFSRLDLWLEENNLLNELTEAPLTQMEGELTDEQREALAKVRELTLDDGKVIARERARLAAAAGPKPALPIRFVYSSLCWALDVLYEGRPIERFWVLETVARMPYFVYISMLHLYESLGWWRAGAELRKVHFAEEWNELHHLQIMEALGGDLRWGDRFLGEHAAVMYYWVLVAIFMISPAASYQFMEMVEGHAADTYAEFAEQNRELLETIPPPLVALNYYKSGDLYLFDQFQTSWKASGETRRPRCNTLYDVFVNIRDDELEHVKTMVACQDGSIALDVGRQQALAEYASQQNITCLAPWNEDEHEACLAAQAAQLEGKQQQQQQK